MDKFQEFFRVFFSDTGFFSADQWQWLVDLLALIAEKIADFFGGGDSDEGGNDDGGADTGDIDDLGDDG
ncbi:MAG: hypothetical protein FWG82_01415 [Oscillospiraceae bacterium]|nr:hypothetical protein [Oscillospiraceae bacterium]